MPRKRYRSYDDWLLVKADSAFTTPALPRRIAPGVKRLPPLDEQVDKLPELGA